MHIRLSGLLLISIALTSCLFFLPQAKADTGLIEILYPNASGDSTTLTPVGATANWNCTDETPHDSDTTYVRSPSTDSNPRYDLFNVQDTSIPSGSTINTVSVYAVVRSLSATYHAIFGVVLKKSGGAVQYGVDDSAPGTSYVSFANDFSSVNLSDLNALQIAIEITSGDKDPTFYAGRCTQVYLRVNYTLVQAGAWNTVTTLSTFLVTRSWQSSGTWSEFLVSRAWQTSASWTNFLISRTWQNVATWSIIFLTLGWHTVTVWSILLLGEDPTNIIVILFLFSVVGFTGFGLYRRRKKS